MAENDGGPSLELPSFGLRRRKKDRRAEVAQEAAADEQTEPPAAPADEASTDLRASEPVAEPVAEAATQPVAEADTEPAAEPTADPTAEPTSEPDAELSAPVAPAEAGGAEEPVQEAEPRKVRTARRPRNRWVGAGLVGLLAGFALVFATNATLRACDAAKGTSSCGGPGLFLLLAILLLILVGSRSLLKLWGFDDAGTVAFLGLGLTAIVALLFLTAHLLSITMVLVIPALCVATFLIGGWLATTMAEADSSE